MLYVCIYVCMLVCMYACLYVCTSCLYVRMYVMFVRTYVRMYVCMSVCVRKCACNCVYACVRMCILVHDNGAPQYAPASSRFMRYNHLHTSLAKVEGAALCFLHIYFHHHGVRRAYSLHSQHKTSILALAHTTFDFLSCTPPMISLPAMVRKKCATPLVPSQ